MVNDLTQSHLVLTAVPVVMIALSLGAATIIFPLGEHQVRLRSSINLAAASLKVLLLIALVPGWWPRGSGPSSRCRSCPPLAVSLLSWC
ncbi:hypothetical protein [Nesterenkonia pannonica]|uniref:hypothetical protein n=1 Tax=Nesterenkonia pannonica TaxID=1548602 RepID=UPI002164A8E1|nr:hypothetical protein [Nesterenkonia pannonica]